MLAKQQGQASVCSGFLTLTLPNTQESPSWQCQVQSSSRLLMQQVPHSNTAASPGTGASLVLRRMHKGRAVVMPKRCQGPMPRLQESTSMVGANLVLRDPTLRSPLRSQVIVAVTVLISAPKPTASSGLNRVPFNSENLLRNPQEAPSLLLIQISMPCASTS